MWRRQLWRLEVDVRWRRKGDASIGEKYDSGLGIEG